MGAEGGQEKGTRGLQEVHERGKRGALMGTKVETVFFIVTHLGHGWDTGAKGAQEVHERGTRGAREVHRLT